jgi:hypothetical protein
VLPLLHLVVVVLLPSPFLVLVLMQVLVLLLMPLVLVHVLLLLFFSSSCFSRCSLLPLFLCSLLCNKEQHDVRPHTPYKQHDLKYLPPPKTKCSCSSADKSENRSARYVPLGRGEKKTTPPPEARKKLCLW